MSAMNPIQNQCDMRIYVADLAAYNNGILSGGWIDLPSDDIDAEVQRILDAGTSARVDAGVYDGVPSEEFAIHDYELPWNIDEWENIHDLNNAARKYDELDDTDRKKVNFLVSQGDNIDKALQLYDLVDIYEDMSYQDLAEQIVDETWNVPEHLEPYIDYEKFARELEMDYAQIGDDLFYIQY